MKLITFKLIDTTQKVLLFLIIAFILLITPSSWIQYPDTGIYLGTAESMLGSFRYWFNGYPNLLYYPAISSLLLLPLSIVGDNFFVLQLYVSVISLTGIWCIRKYYSYQSYGAIGFFLPFLVLLSSIYSVHIYALSSDCIFLTVTMLALLSWRKYESTNARKYLFWCIFFVSSSALVRFQGVFICAALSLAIFVRAWNSDVEKRIFNLCVALLISAIIFMPFLLWTMRNFLSYTPDTFNMANSYFFSLRGLSLYAKGLPGGVSSEDVNSLWQFSLYRSALYIGGLFEFLYGGISLNNKIIILPFLLILMVLGIKPWVKRANHLELFYVIFSGLFFVKSVVFPHNLHIILRYWIPLLPFVFLMIGLGIQTIINYSLLAPIKKYTQGGAIFVTVLLLIMALPKITKQQKLEDYRQMESVALASVADFFDRNIPKESIVATTDWGVMPRTINRTSYLVLNDPGHKETIARMVKYKTEFLVAYGKFPRMNNPTLTMITEYPDAFTLLFSKNKDQPSLSIFVYKVDLKVLSKYV